MTPRLSTLHVRPQPDGSWELGVGECGVSLGREATKARAVEAAHRMQRAYPGSYLLRVHSVKRAGSMELSLGVLAATLMLGVLVAGSLLLRALWAAVRGWL